MYSVIQIIFMGSNRLVDWLEDNMLTCPSKALSGVDCPGCGMQRSIIHLLRGEFADAFILYAPIYPLIFTMLLLGMHLFFNNKKTRIALKYAYILSATTIVLNFIYKLIYLT